MQVGFRYTIIIILAYYKHDGLLVINEKGIFDMDDVIPVIPMEEISISEYESDLTKHFDTIPEVAEILLREAKFLFSNIEQEAVQGKLVPQNPNDESASVLLEKIA